jgi:acyl CoA:acetate/3-ketoacid CoA transferase alpha subunit
VVEITRNYVGTLTGTGAVPLQQGGLPAHLRAAGSGIPGVSQPTKGYVFAEDTRNKSLTVDLGTATVALEGCNGDPTVAGDWFALETAISADGVISTSKPAKFVRANVTAHTSGAVNVRLGMTS